MTTKKTVTVFGATGAQGGSICRSILADGHFAVRALTRNPNGPKTAWLAAAGAEIVQCDINTSDEAAVTTALQGTWGLYMMLDTWSPANVGQTALMVEQGKRIIRAAVAAGVEVVVHSGGPTTDPVKYPSAMCNGSTEVVKYLFEQDNILAVVPMLGWYMTNWSELFPPRLAEDGMTVEFAYPIYGPDFKFPMVSTTDDTGPIVLGIFKSPETYRGKTFYLASEYVTLPEMAAAYSRVTGQPARHVVCPGDYHHASLGRNPEWTNLALDNNAKGAFDSDWANWPGGWTGEGGSLGPSVALHPAALTWEAWVRKSGFDVRKAECQARMQTRPAEWDA